jgi:hypothetical protein
VVGSVYHLKQFTTWWKNFADEKGVEMEVQKWLRQQSKDFYAAGFDAVVKRLEVY